MYTKTYLCPDGLVVNSRLYVTYKSDYINEWLGNQKAFSYFDDVCSYRCHKDSKGYWTAQKKVKGVCKKIRLGKRDRMSFDRLAEISIRFSDQLANA